VFYYVLSGGRHPFGDQYRRQANIIAGEYNVDKIINSECMELYLFYGFICHFRKLPYPNWQLATQKPCKFEMFLV